MTIFRPSLVLCITLALPISACRSRTYNPGPSGSLSTKSTAGASKPQSVDGVLGIPVVQYLRKEKAPVTLWTSENVGEDIGGAEILETFADGRKEVLIQLKPPSGLQADVDVLPSGEPFLPTPGALPDNADDWIQYEAPCNLISRFHGGYDVVKDAKLNCIVFSGGLAVDPIETVIPVGPKYAGFVSKGPARDALQPGAMRPLPTTSVASDKSFDIPPARPNESVDAATLLPVMLDMLKVLKPGQEMRVRPCLRNPLTNRWGDLALHFYCQIPKDMRTCYSTAVLTERRRLMTSDFKPMASATPAERNALAVKATLAAHGLANAPGSLRGFSFRGLRPAFAGRALSLHALTDGGTVALESRDAEGVTCMKAEALLV